MTRVFEGDELVVATHNNGKIRELKALFGDRVKTLRTAGDFGLEAPAETGTTFLENATIKALATATATGKIAIADDSGICVDVLDGAPGLYTADWAEEYEGGPRDWMRAMTRVRDEMLKTGEWEKISRRAHYVACLVLAWPDGHVETVEGHAYGEVVWPPRGDKGFGFDPMFKPDRDARTYGEMTTEEKAEDNHRSEAFKKLIAKCFPR